MSATMYNIFSENIMVIFIPVLTGFIGGLLLMDKYPSWLHEFIELFPNSIRVIFKRIAVVVLIISIILTIVLLCGFAYSLNFAKVPNLIDLPSSEAKGILRDRDFMFCTYGEDTGSSKIIKQVPEAFSIEQKGTTIHLFFSDVQINDDLLVNDSIADSSYSNSNYRISVDSITAFPDCIYGFYGLYSLNDWTEQTNCTDMSVRGQVYKKGEDGNLSDVDEHVLFSKDMDGYFQFSQIYDTLSDGEYICRVYVYYDQSVMMINITAKVVTGKFQCLNYSTHYYFDGKFIEDQFHETMPDGRIPGMG